MEFKNYIPCPSAVADAQYPKKVEKLKLKKKLLRNNIS